MLLLSGDIVALLCRPPCHAATMPLRHFSLLSLLMALVMLPHTPLILFSDSMPPCFHVNNTIEAP